MLENPATPCLQVVGLEPDGLTPMSFGTGNQYVFLVEGVFGAVSDIGAQKRLDSLLGSDAVSEAVESDTTSSGALFSRLQENGVVLTGQSAAADSVSFAGYRGQSRVQMGEKVVLLATWAVRVLA